MNILRKIFYKQFRDFEQQINNLKKEKESLQNELSKANNMVSEKADKICSLEAENSKLKSRVEELEKENEILRKYYNLNEEPSDEIKAKIHIDLEINRLKEEKMQIAMLASRLPITQMYPVYYPALERWY